MLAVCANGLSQGVGADIEAALTEALQEYPILNSSVDGTRIVYPEERLS